MRTLECLTLPGLTGFAAAYELQMRYLAELARAPEREARLILLQHPPVYTLGRATRPEHLRHPAEELARRTGAEVLSTDRGGSVTYHGPGQQVAYLLLNLKAWDLRIHQHLWNLEEIAIRALAKRDVKGERVEGLTGVWVADPESASGVPPSPAGNPRLAFGDSPSATRNLQSPVGEPQSAIGNRQSAIAVAKICAIGVGCRRGVTYHGLSLNVDLDLTPFAEIDPCGLGYRPVTSLAQTLGRRVALAEAEAALVTACAEVLGAEVRRAQQ